MQSQRGYSMRRSPTEDQAPSSSSPSSITTPISPPAPGVQSRSSVSSIKSSSQSGSTRRPQRESSTSGGSGSNIPLSQIEKSVTHLLVATKQLLETLTQWSRGQATDTQVSDVYVRLGYEFNMACRAFTAINVDTSDLGNVPDLLRNILEATLSQEASSESLEKYLPRIRDIIINLLHGLKRKQQRLRQRQGRDREGQGQGVPERTTSVSTVTSATSGLTNMLDEGLSNGNGYQQQEANASPTRRTTLRDPPKGPAPTELPTPPQLQQQSSASSQQAAPYPADDGGIPASSSASSLADIDPDSFPPPPESQSSAMAALQQGGMLERRASRRYSQYQISKHLGGSGPGVPILPPQNGPIPNRGRKEARESLRAVQKRESVRHSRNESSQQGSSPMRVPSRVSEESSSQQEPTEADVPMVRSPDEKYAPTATLSGPMSDPMQYVDDERPTTSDAAKRELKNPEITVHQHQQQQQQLESKQNETFFQVSPPPTPTKDLTLFLQYKSKVKKFVLPEGRDELSIGRLQLAFIEKFSWNTQQNGTDLPEIYIQDPVSGIRHELEDLSDIKDRTVLVLNVEALDEVKKHFDDGLSDLTKMIREMKQNVDDQALTLRGVSDRQQETTNEVARLANAPPPVIVQTPTSAAATGGSRNPVGGGPKLGAGHVSEIQNLRRDIAVLRQTYSTFQTDIQTSMSTLRQKANTVKVAAAKAVGPDVDGDAGYSYVTNGRKKLNADSDRLVGKVDDLQDLVEDLRKDVAQRGVRPLPRQIQDVTGDISELSKELKRMEEYMAAEKPIWTKIWEKELEDVCQGRDELRLMEDLLVDLRDDIEKASETFTLVQQATKEHTKDTTEAPATGGIRSFSRGLNNLGNSLDQNAAKEGLLGEVRALQPNHQDRLDAIERAEKLRQKELEGRRGNAMQIEIEDFVSTGKLKKSGGYEEVERARIAADERIRKEVWDRMNGLLPEDDDEEEEEEDEEEDEEEFEEAAEEQKPAT